MSQHDKRIAVLGMSEKLVQNCAHRISAPHEAIACPPEMSPQLVAEALGARLGSIVTVVDLGDIESVFAGNAGWGTHRARRWFAQVEACDVLVLNGTTSAANQRLLDVVQPRARRLTMAELETVQSWPAFSAEETGHGGGLYRLLLASSLRPATGARSDVLVDDHHAHVYRAQRPFSSEAFRFLLRAWPARVVRAFGYVAVEGRVLALEQCGRGNVDVIDEGDVGEHTELVLLGQGLDALRLQAWFDRALVGALARASPGKLVVA